MANRLPWRSGARYEGTASGVVLVLVLVIVLGFSCVGMAESGEEAEVNWVLDYHQGLEQAQQEKKPVLLDFYADWCGPCGMMDAQTYSDPKVVKALKDFVCIKLNIDEQEQVAFAYRVQSIPRTIALNVHGEIVGDIVGFTESDLFLFFLEDAKNNAQKRIQGPIVSVPRGGVGRAAQPQPSVGADTETAGLVELLSNPNPATRDRAQQECLRRNTPEIREALMAGLTDDYLGARIGAWHTLRKMVSGLGDQYDPWASPAERGAAAEALRKGE